MICRRTAENYIRIARTLAEHPAFKAFVYERGGHSKLLTLLQMCSEEQIADIAENEELLDKIDQMSNRQLKKGLRRAREKMDQAVKKAVEKTAAENAELKTKVDELTTALATPDLEAAVKLIRAANKKVDDALQLLRRVDWKLVSSDWTVRLAALQVTNLIGNLVSTIDADILSQEMPEPPAKGGG
jgi:5'-3' exonuclease